MPIIIAADPLAPEEFPADLPTRLYLGDSGIVLCGGSDPDTDAFGCTWSLTTKNTWGPKPSPRAATGDRNYDHGQWDATKYFNARTIPITGQVDAPDHATLHAAYQRLNDAVSITPFEVRGTEPGFDSFVTARQDGDIDWAESPRTSATFSFSLYAPDPLIYSTLERPFSIDFPVASGGLTWPATWPATWSGGGFSGQTVLNNPGRLPVGLRLRIDGPVTGAEVGFPDLGRSLVLANPLGDVLDEGQWLDIDTTTRQVLLNGEATRRGWLTGNWLQLPPNTETTLAITGSGTGPGSRVSGSYRAARI